MRDTESAANCSRTVRGSISTDSRAHDLRHGMAMEILEQHHDLEAVRAMLGHTRIDTTQTYARIRPAQLKRAVEFYEEKAVGLLDK